jgi:DNA-binding GntR family transcriptional regulator
MKRRLLGSASSVAEDARALPNRDLRFEPLVGQIATFVQDEIMLGRYKPGERVREQEIADQLEVSRGPVREALRVLEKRGLVEIVPWRGARVVSLSAHELNEVFQVRGALFTMMAKLAAVYATDEEIDRLEQAVEELDAMAHRNVTMADFLRKRYSCADMLMVASHNQTAADMQRVLVQRTQGYYTATSQASQEMRMESVVLYRQMIEALRQRQPAAAEDVAHRLADTNRAAVLAMFGQGLGETDAPRPSSKRDGSRRSERKPNS